MAAFSRVVYLLIFYDSFVGCAVFRKCAARRKFFSLFTVDIITVYRYNNHKQEEVLP